MVTTRLQAKNQIQINHNIIEKETKILKRKKSTRKSSTRKTPKKSTRKTPKKSTRKSSTRKRVNKLEK